MNRAERRALGLRGPQPERHPTVEFAYLTDGNNSDAFTQSLIRMRDYELVRTQQLVGVRSRRARSGSIDKARNEVTTMFVRSDTDYILWCDSDMGFPRHALHMMLDVADPIERPIIGGLCFAHRTAGFDEETNAELFEMIPTLSVWQRDENDTIVAWNSVFEYPRNAVCKIESTGAAFVLIHRSVLERMQEAFGDNWWSCIKHPVMDNQRFGEDTSFFLRAAELEIPVFAHTGVRTSHDKGGIFLTEAAWDAQQAARAADTAGAPAEAA